MITLYHAPQSRSSRMIWLLEELGADLLLAPEETFEQRALPHALMVRDSTG